MGVMATQGMDKNQQGNYFQFILMHEKMEKKQPRLLTKGCGNMFRKLFIIFYKADYLRSEMQKHYETFPSIP